ncbi:MAG TPA: hypothetical protein VMI54_03675 [Polyangiaceae bacterium]|nr:hypothetical protein [Polyangiaceae bacterium]
MSEQRARLTSATAIAFARNAAPTVATVASVARVSRNTFYEYFDDLEHARGAGEARARRRLEVALREAEQRARTPVERWRELVQAWVAWVLEFPEESRLVLAGRDSGLSVAGGELAGAFTRSLALARAAGLNAATQDAIRVTAVAAAAEVTARALSVEQMTTEAGAMSAPARERLERALVDIAVRLLR